MLDLKGWNKIIKSVLARYENIAPAFKNDVTYFHTWRWAGWCASRTRDDIYTRWRHPPRDTPRSRRMRVDNASADRPPAPQTERQSLEPAPQWRPPGWCSTPHSSCIHRWSWSAMWRPPPPCCWPLRMLWAAVACGPWRDSRRDESSCCCPHRWRRLLWRGCQGRGSWWRLSSLGWCWWPRGGQCRLSPSEAPWRSQVAECWNVKKS